MHVPAAETCLLLLQINAVGTLLNQQLNQDNQIQQGILGQQQQQDSQIQGQITNQLNQDQQNQQALLNKSPVLNQSPILNQNQQDQQIQNQLTNQLNQDQQNQQALLNKGQSPITQSPQSSTSPSPSSSTSTGGQNVQNNVVPPSGRHLLANKRRELLSFLPNLDDQVTPPIKQCAQNSHTRVPPVLTNAPSLITLAQPCMWKVTSRLARAAPTCLRMDDSLRMDDLAVLCPMGVSLTVTDALHSCV